MFSLPLRRITLTALAALALCAVTAPASARPSYPIKAEEYRQQVQKRVDTLWESIEKKLDFHNVSPERKKAIRKMLDEEARPMWVELQHASADGNITRDEALKIREMHTLLRGKLRARMAADKKAQETAEKAAAAAADKKAKEAAEKAAAAAAPKPAATAPAHPATPPAAASAKAAPPKADPAKGTKADPKAAKADAKVDPKTAKPAAKADPKAAKSEPKVDPKTVKPAAKAEPKAAKSEPKAAKSEPKAKTAEKQGIRSTNSSRWGFEE